MDILEEFKPLIPGATRSMIRQALRATVGLKDVEVRQNTFNRVLGALLTKRTVDANVKVLTEQGSGLQKLIEDHNSTVSGPSGTPEAE